MNRKQVAVAIVIVFGIVFGGAVTTLGATGPDAAAEKSPSGEVLAQDQAEANAPVAFENQTTETVEDPVDEKTVQFRIDSVRVEAFSFVVGDADDVDRTVVVEDRSVTDRTVRVDLTAILSGSAVEESVGEAASGDRQISRSDVQSVRFVLRNVSIRNVEFVVTAPEDAALDLPDEMVSDTTTVTETETTTEETPTETTTEEPAGEPSLRVSELTAPGAIVLNEGELVVTAEVSNPSDQSVTDTVELRIDGTVVERRHVEVAPGEASQVQFRVNRADLDLEPGEAFLEVLTRDFGESIRVTVRDAPADEADGDDDNQ